MKTGYVAAAALALGVLALMGGDDASQEEGVEPDEGDDGQDRPRVGFQPQAAPVDVMDWEDDEPRCGAFYQVRRGDMWLGRGPKSITWRALFRLGVDAGQGDEMARQLADSVGLRRALAQLIGASSWNDALYGTWGYGPKDFVCKHGRAIPLAAVHSDNRALLRAQRAPERVIERGDPSWRGSGRSVGVTGSCRPYIWIPQVDVSAVLEHGTVTTEGIVWPGDLRLSCLEPPQGVWVIGAVA